MLTTLQHGFVRLLWGCRSGSQGHGEEHSPGTDWQEAGASGAHLLAGDMGRLGSSSLSAVYLLCDLG